jgi:hypothetical protein
MIECISFFDYICHAGHDCASACRLNKGCFRLPPDPRLDGFITTASPVLGRAMARAPMWLALWAIIMATIALTAQSWSYISDVGGLGNTSLLLARGRSYTVTAHADSSTMYYVVFSKTPQWNSTLPYGIGQNLGCVLRQS